MQYDKKKYHNLICPDIDDKDIHNYVLAGLTKNSQPYLRNYNFLLSFLQLNNICEYKLLWRYTTIIF